MLYDLMCTSIRLCCYCLLFFFEASTLCFLWALMVLDYLEILGYADLRGFGVGIVLFNLLFV